MHGEGIGFVNIIMKITEILLSEEQAGTLAGEVFNPSHKEKQVHVPRNDAIPRNPATKPTSGIIMRKDPMIPAPLDPMLENLRPASWRLPPEPGTAPIPAGHVRLYHQTNPENLGSIKHHGISLDRARGIEGPRAIYADEKGFYGSPGDVPTVEFHVPAELWDRPFVKADVVPPENILGVHRRWHSTARYIEEDPKIIQRVLSGGHDNLLNDPHYGKAIRYIKHKYSAPMQQQVPQVERS